ncbi:MULTISPECIES: DUF1109 domain-containing protein [Pseudomonas]|jgi:hypothetical protein|uniref:DUF1109 domain-containing protein n=1 Tax=Pseudomonas reactans TaxID=117680 RepID=A0A7Y8FYV9_9PSED|nr:MULTISPECIES: DUF1109 domain-containing protein [Pseudomonas]MCK8654732.1 DUF1109 domain-containing protein [Pseudomonas umsongensis]NWA45911.1 DUF1109 domain-containing protein [Pseudomonas reactans]NWD98634.1 DUF1109 domain-containing protein [Pseudomonas reactans]NWE88025.1 DUF1109 domain-containing protein [Pseudomonas reactans]
MKTDDLISMLATGVTPIDRHALAKRFGVAVLVGLITAFLLVMVMFGARPDLAEVAATPIFWAKIALPLCLMVGALSQVVRLARPGVTPGAGQLLVIAAVAAVWAGALYVLITAAPDVRASMIFGKTWRVCALNITLLSIPGFIAVFWALGGLAPTRLRLAGACGGLLSGAMATIAYCLHCPEMEVPFWGVWYLLGMLIPTVIGALLGPRWLRW